MSEEGHTHYIPQFGAKMLGKIRMQKFMLKKMLGSPLASKLCEVSETYTTCLKRMFLARDI